MQPVSFLAHATVITLLPVAMALFHHAQDMAFNFLTDDAYLYLGIARHSPEAFFSFDGMRPINGFHPLWQYHVWMMAEVFRDRPLALSNAVALTAIALTWIGVLRGALAAQNGKWLFFRNARAELKAPLRTADPDTRLLKLGGGKPGFRASFPTRHGFSLADDAQNLAAQQVGWLLRDSHAADGSRVLASHKCLRVTPEAVAWGTGQIRKYLTASHLDDRIKAEPPLFYFQMSHIARPTGIAFIRIIKREAEAAPDASPPGDGVARP